MASEPPEHTGCGGSGSLRGYPPRIRPDDIGEPRCPMWAVAIPFPERHQPLTGQRVWHWCFHASHAIPVIGLSTSAFTYLIRRTRATSHGADHSLSLMHSSDNCWQVAAVVLHVPTGAVALAKLIVEPSPAAVRSFWRAMVTLLEARLLDRKVLFGGCHTSFQSLCP